MTAGFGRVLQVQLVLILSIFFGQKWKANAVGGY
jgi:hypothetical protein